MDHKVLSRSRALILKGVVLVQRVELRDKSITLTKVGEVIGEWIGDCLRRIEQFLKILRLYIFCHKLTFKLVVDCLSRGESIWVITEPAVVIDSGVQRL